eukprot:CCRYP_011242-RB/>CCRYP_011242-RB protein AED:0.05 eAED:0.05 QI:415/1/1/1/0.9/0.81/11/3311/1034
MCFQKIQYMVQQVMSSFYISRYYMTETMDPSSEKPRMNDNNLNVVGTPMGSLQKLLLLCNTPEDRTVCEQGGSMTQRKCKFRLSKHFFSRQQYMQRSKHTPHFASVKYSCFLLAAMLMLTKQHMTTNAQEIVAGVPDVDYELNALNNPDNKFCGLSYAEAHDFCHLPPKQSLPCPNGESECPYGMPCWEIREECTQPPTLTPTVSPSKSPITEISSDPTDYYFCGLGFDQLYDCAVHCPGGTQEECPEGQICYFNTPCDARLLSTPAPSVTVTDITASISEPADVSTPSNTTSSGGTENIITDDSNTTTSAGEEDENYDVINTDDANMTVIAGGGESGTSGNRNFCGETYIDASTNCSREKHCPSGLSTDCPEGLNCFSFLPNCNIDEMPTPAPTLSPPPTSSAPTSSTPTITPSPTLAPIGKDDMRYFFFCGLDWMDASTRCYKQCISGFHSDCPTGEQCFAQADCQKGVIAAPPTTSAPTILNGTQTPTVSQTPTFTPTISSLPSIFTSKSPEVLPTLTPTTAAPTLRPTYAPCEGEPCPQEDYCRSAAGYCGPGEQYCNNNSIWMASCEDLTDSPAVEASASPAISPLPTINSTVTSSLEVDEENAAFAANMSVTPTVTPAPIPSISTPTVTVSVSPTATPLPTLNRSSELLLGGDEGNATVAANISASPTITPAPFASISTAPSYNGTGTGNATAEATLVTSTPTAPPADSSNIDEDCIANPDGPLCSFFCGFDWNQAITECPQRCPSGDSADCPDGWSCYAFTPCIAIGVNTPPTLKPTWEPTGHPVSNSPTTSVHYWNEQNKNETPPEADVVQLWTNAPTLKPTYSPTMDQCRAPPCDNSGECRSELGFCGTGIIYCNSMSSWKPECIGGVSMMESAPEVTPRPSPANKGGPPSFSPTTKWDAWVGSKYANSDSSASLNETTTVAAAGSNSTEAEGDLMNGTVTAEPTQSPMADPFSWVSSGTFNGEGYSSSSMNSDSPWWDDRGSSGARTMSPCVTIVPCVIIVYAVMFLYDCRKTSREVGSILSFK